MKIRNYVNIKILTLNEMPDKNKKIALSLCMIVKNEEKHLPGCLASIKGLVDEIIIVDTGSTDATVKIAEQYDADVSHYEWNDDFASARNYSLEHAKGEWILCLDADEEIDEENRKKLFKLISRAEKNSIAYYLNFKSRVRESSFGSELIHSHARLFRNGLDICFKGRIHEQIIDSVICAGGKIEPTDIIVDHKGYEEEQMSGKGKIERNVSILKKMFEEDDETQGMTCFYLGENYSMLNRWEEAIRYYELSVLKKGIPRQNRALVYQNLGTAYFNTGNYPETLRNERLSLKLQPERITPHGVIAETAMASGNYDLAIWEWKSALTKLNTVEIGVFDKLSDHIFEPDMVNLRLGEAYFWSKDYPAARSRFSELVHNDRFICEAKKWLAKTAFAENNFEDAEKYIDEAQKIKPGDPETVTIKGKIAGNTGNLEKAINYFKSALEIDEKYIDAGKSLATIYIARSDLNSAEQVLEKFEEFEHNQDLQKLRAQIQLYKGNAEKVLTLLKPFDKENQIDFELYFYLAFASEMAGNVDEALEFCSKAIRLNPADPRFYCLQGNILIKKNLHSEAVTSYRKTLSIQENIPDAWKGIGIASVKLMNFEGAKEAFENAYRLQPDDQQTKRSLAAVYGKLGMTKEAEKFLLMTKTS